MRKISTFIFSFCFFLISFTAKAENRYKPGLEVDLVFCIDMSGSTNGIIPDMKNRIWEVVNNVYKFRPSPCLRIGIIGFSRPSFGRENAYVKVLSNLTRDYEQVYYELEMLKPAIEKGDQYVGAALEMAGRMKWSENPKALRVVYLIGNGAVNAGGTAYRNMCEVLLRKNIFVNTIYCFQQNIIPREIAGWKSIADNTGGQFYTYQINRTASPATATSETNALAELNNNLNDTYIYYGKPGKIFMETMFKADKSSLQLGPSVFFPRMHYKITEQCQENQAKWDLVNFVKAAGTDFSSISKSSLPDNMKNQDEASITRLVLIEKDNRSRLMKQIKSFLAANGSDTLVPDSNQLQGIIYYSVHKLAKDKGFFNNP